jgi:hypothetical protein
MFLDQLGNTADEVAMTLKAKGIQGVPHTVRFLNPIVRYLQAEIVETRAMDVILGDRLRIGLPNDRQEEPPLPKPSWNSLMPSIEGRIPNCS